MPLDPFSLWLFSDRAGTSVHLSAQDFSSHQLEPEEGCVCTLLEGGRRASLLSRPFGCCQFSEKQRLVVRQPGSSPWHGLLGQATVGYSTFRNLTLAVHKPLMSEVCGCVWPVCGSAGTECDPARAG